MKTTIMLLINVTTTTINSVTLPQPSIEYYG